VALESYNEAVIVCPPDTYKSTTVRDYVEREIGKNPNVRILWLMNAGAQSTKQIMAVQQTLEFNNVYKALSTTLLSKRTLTARPQWRCRGTRSEA